jgi:hypothetical protein
MTAVTQEACESDGTTPQRGWRPVLCVRNRSCKQLITKIESKRQRVKAAELWQPIGRRRVDGDDEARGDERPVRKRLQCGPAPLPTFRTCFATSSTTLLLLSGLDSQETSKVATDTAIAAGRHSRFAAMDLRSSQTPPATARPRNSSSSITSSHAASPSRQPSMTPSSRTARGTASASSRSAAPLDDESKPTRPASKDSLKQKMLKKVDEAPRPNRSEEVHTMLA